MITIVQCDDYVTHLKGLLPAHSTVVPCVLAVYLCECFLCAGHYAKYPTPILSLPSYSCLERKLKCGQGEIKGVTVGDAASSKQRTQLESEPRLPV